MMIEPEIALIDKLSSDDTIKILTQRAYIMATIKHETAGTFLPIAEYGHGAGMPYAPLYYGRGYVQITWERNYQKFSTLLNEDLVNNPDLALRPDLAYKIITLGMAEGLFTGRKMDDYLNDDLTDYFHARRVVNGTDKASLIAGYAKTYENYLISV